MLSVPVVGYSRNASCVLNLISTFLLSPSLENVDSIPKFNTELKRTGLSKFLNITIWDLIFGVLLLWLFPSKFRVRAMYNIWLLEPVYR